MSDIYSQLFVVDVVDNICNLVLRFYDVSFLVSFFYHYTLVIWVTKNIRCIKTVVFLILSEIKATIYVLAGVLVCTKYDY